MSITTPYDYVSLAALSHPDAIALVTPTSTFTFAELRRATRNIAGVLREHGVRAGDIVVTKLSADLDWLLTLALFHEAVVTCSVWDDAHVPGVGASLFITDTATTHENAATPTLVIDHAWVRRAADEDNSYEPVAYGGDDAMVRLVLTSGTTGMPKLARYNLGPIVRRNENKAIIETPGVILNLMGMAAMGSFYQGMGHLVIAKPFFILDAINERTGKLIADHGVNILVGSPLNIGELVEALRSSGDAVPSISAVFVVGSTPSDRLITAIREQFGVDARISYGSTEGGAVTTRVISPGDDPRIVGYPYPGVTLEIVDEHDVPVDAGETGFIRYKTFDMIEEYFRDPAATAAAFRDGYFYPGDRGYIAADSQLVLAGRIDELLNVGGVKIDPLDIDRAVMEFAGVLDAAAFVAERTSTTPRLAVAVVGDVSLDLQSIDAAMRLRFPNRYPSIYLDTDVIPRNAAGKILRGALEGLLGDNDFS